MEFAINRQSPDPQEGDYKMSTRHPEEDYKMEFAPAILSSSEIAKVNRLIVPLEKLG